MTMTVEQARKILGKSADEYTDDELLEVINTFVVISDIAIDSYLEKRKSVDTDKALNLASRVLNDKDKG